MCAGCFLEFPGTSWTAVKEVVSKADSSLSVPITIRHETDPYLYFLDISKGSGDFGLSTGEKVRHHATELRQSSSCTPGLSIVRCASTTWQMPSFAKQFTSRQS
jgi:hypothetical protein